MIEVPTQSKFRQFIENLTHPNRKLK